LGGRRVIPLSHRSHITGYQPFAAGMASIEHESALERDFVTLTRFDPAVLSIVSQPETITWTDKDGRCHLYTPDYRVVRADRTEVVEVKYRASLREGWSSFRPAFAAARAWFGGQGSQFRIVTESGIRIPRLENAKRLLPLNNDSAHQLSHMRVLAHLTAGTPKPFSEVVTAVTSPEIPRGELLAAMWTLLANRKLLADFDQVIDGRSLVWLA